MDDGGEVLTVRQRRGGEVMTLERSRHRAIEEGRGHLHRIAGHHARVQRVEPTRSQVAPGAILDHDVVMDAVALCFGERSVGDLKHPDRARRRPVYFEWVPAESPSPV